MDNNRDSLVDGLKAGDRLAAEELVERFYRQIYLYMRRLGHTGSTSEDLTQESFVRVWQNIGQLKNDSALSGWIYRIAANVSRHYWRKNARQKYLDLEVLEVLPAQEQDIDTEDIEFLRDAVNRLPMKLREVVVLHYIQQLTIEQAAYAVGVVKGTFRSRLSRALKKIRKEYIGQDR